jgi:two-component system, NarL family, sensor histidine kinase UhpB
LLNNIAKHAGASRVEVQLRHTGSSTSLRVRRCRGFDVASPRKNASAGLVGLRERV